MADRIVLGFVLFAFGWQVGDYVRAEPEQTSCLSEREIVSIARHTVCQTLVGTRIVNNCTVLGEAPE